MAAHRTLVSASILDSDLANLSRECRRAIKGGADRLHFDVMDGHFVANISFGPAVIKRARKAGTVPFDAHLMIAQPGRHIDEFIDAGCDSITCHVEIEEPIRPILERIRRAGRLAGLALKPGTPLSALDPYRDLLDIVMVMTVEPGLGGQKFIPAAAPKIGAAHDVFRDRPGERSSGRGVHVDGGVNRDSAALCGSYGADVLVVGSTLWRKGHVIGREIERIKALADEAYRNRGAG